MRKILSIGLVFCIVFSILICMITVTQALEINTGGTTSKVTYNQVGNNEEIRIFASNPVVVNQYVIPPEGSIKHYRLCFEISNVTVKNSVKFDVNQGSVGQIRLANMSDPIRTNVVVECKVKPNYTLIPSADQKSLVLTLKGTVSGSSGNTESSNPPSTPKPETTPKPSISPKPGTTPEPTLPETSPIPASGNGSGIIDKLGPLSWSLTGDTCKVKLNGITLKEASSGTTPRFEFREKEKLIHITVPGKISGLNDGFLSGNSVIYGILVNYNNKLNITNIRISFSDKISYSHSVTNGNSIISIKKAGGASVSPPPAASSTPTPSKTPASSSTPKPETKATVSFSFKSGSVDVIAPESALSDVKVYKIGVPSRIVIEVPGTAAETEKLMASGALYTKATVEQASTSLVKVQLYTTDNPDWNLTKNSGSLTLSLIKTNIAKVQYGNGDGNVALRIVDEGIVNRYREYKSEIIEANSFDYGTFTCVIPTAVVNLGTGKTSIEDGLSKSVQTLVTSTSSLLQLNKFDFQKEYKLVEGTTSDELLIIVSGTISKNPGSTENNSGSTEKNDNSKLVVLDPGHGGYDPGATVGDKYLEKDYNLDIAKRCEAILKAKGINVAMTRNTDVYVGLDERAEFANSRKASLFVSIHNNIMPEGYKGTMTLYYPTSTKGKAYANIIQDNLVKDLKTKDIGLKANGNLVVVKKTHMPAVLAEIACMSDPGDLQLLNTQEFRQKAAESLARSIIEIFNSM